MCLTLLFLLLSSVTADIGQTFEGSANLADDYVESIIKALPVVNDLFNNIFGNVNKFTFGFLLDRASSVVEALFPPRPLPAVPERWWGDAEGPQDPSIRTFKVHFSHEVSLDIHYIHVKPPNPHEKKVLPILLVHGWPVTVFEFVHVIDHLLRGREECDFVFEVVVPHLPGFGYSEATNKIGMSQYQMAVILKNLMLRLGKPRFYVHAGGIGQPVADAMAVLFPDRVLGLHTNLAFSIRPITLVKYVLGQMYPSAVVEPRYQDRLYPLATWAKFYLENSGYFHIQATRPDNLGHGLDDSPVAQASWMIENIITATSPDNNRAVNGRLNQTFDMLDWFDSFTVYWASRSISTGARACAELCAWIQDPLALTILTTPTPVPFAAIRFRHELVYQPDAFLRDKYPSLLQASTLDFGGHFAGYEEPAVLADSIWMSVKKMDAFNAGKGVVL